MLENVIEIDNLKLYEVGTVQKFIFVFDRDKCKIKYSCF